MSYPMFDRARLHIRPLAERVHDMTLADVLPLDHPGEPYDSPDLAQVAERIIRARAQGKPVIVLMGAHVIKAGLSRFVIDLMARGLITHVGMNGAGPIHDYESALPAGPPGVATSARAIGLWQERDTSTTLWPQAWPMGWLWRGAGPGHRGGDYPYRHRRGRRHRLRARDRPYRHRPDIIHEHPNCDGRAGEASYRDFLIFTEPDRAGRRVMLNYGTAVMGPGCIQGAGDGPQRGAPEGASPSRPCSTC